MIDKKILNMMARLKRDRSTLMDNVLKNPQCKWKKKTKDILEKYNICEWELAEEKNTTKEIINDRTRAKFEERLKSIPEDKSKIKFFHEGKKEWETEVTSEYMMKMTRKQVSTIFRARTRMLKVKGNYKNGHSDLKCRACKNAVESQNHVLIECPALHPHGLASRKSMDPFSENINTLKATAQHIDNPMTEINNDRSG